MMVYPGTVSRGVPTAVLDLRWGIGGVGLLVAAPGEQDVSFALCPADEGFDEMISSSNSGG